jgi:hypothetical protein
VHARGRGVIGRAGNSSRAGQGVSSRATGAPRGNRNAQTHGIYSLGRRLKSAGLAKVDGRSALERLKADWKAEIRAARGGQLSPQLEVLLETASNTWLMLSSADDFILEHGVVNKRRGSLRPIVEQRAKLVRSLRELLGAIGLDDDEYVERRGEALWGELARRNGSSATRRASTAPRGSQCEHEGDFGDDADPISEPMGPPGFGADGRSIPQEFPDNSEEPRSQAEPADETHLGSQFPEIPECEGGDG